ncbi:MAG: hypothetical protein K0M49_01575 [Arenimonas sp.]|nr:hypothetical protein [Rhizobium sp.]MBW8444295.1 hypothetical protein [Arenimonas sp.]
MITLMTDEDYDHLPEDPTMRFVALEGLCRRNVTQILHDADGDYVARLAKQEYMRTVASAASTLEIDGPQYPTNLGDPIEGFEVFLGEATATATRLRLQNTTHRAGSVRLSERSRGRIELQLRRLEDLINSSDMPDERRVRLRRRLEEFRSELDSPRLNLGRAMTILAALGLGVTTGTSFLADAPEAIATVVSIIGADKEAEDREQVRLGAPPKMKALPAPPNATTSWEDQELTDDIPF